MTEPVWITQNRSAGAPASKIRVRAGKLTEALARRVAQITAHRMRRARARMLDLYSPHGSGAAA